MKAIIIALIVLGIVGLVLSAVLPIIGLPAIPGSLAALLAGIGFSGQSLLLLQRLIRPQRSTGAPPRAAARRTKAPARPAGRARRRHP